MADTNTGKEDEVEEIEDETFEDEDVEVETSEERKSRLKSELQELRDEGVTDAEIKEITGEIEDAIDDAVESVEEDGESVEDAADEAADEVEDALKSKGVTLSPPERKSLVEEIATAVHAKMTGETPGKREKVSTKRRPDNPPRSTHWSERSLFGSKG